MTAGTAAGPDAPSASAPALPRRGQSLQSWLADGAVFGVFGTGGRGREVAWMARDLGLAPDRLRFVVDPEFLNERTIDGIPVLHAADFSRRHPGAPMFVAVGDCRARRSIAGRLEERGHVFPTLVSRHAVVSDLAALSRGVIVYPGAVVTVNVQFDRHVHLDSRASVSHDVSIGEFTSLSPGAIICGHVEIGADVFIGASACVINGAPGRRLTVGAGSFVKAGAVVVRPVPGGSHVG